MDEIFVEPACSLAPIESLLCYTILQKCAEFFETSIVMKLEFGFEHIGKRERVLIKWMVTNSYRKSNSILPGWLLPVQFTGIMIYIAFKLAQAAAGDNGFA
jgi:hypothetical protein